MSRRLELFRSVEAELMYYHDTKKELELLRKNVILGHPIQDITGIRGSLPGDPTARKATVLATSRILQHMELVVESVETLMAELPEEKRELIRLRYWERPRILTWDGIAKKLHVSRRQVFRWRDEIIYALAGLLGVRI